MRVLCATTAGAGHFAGLLPFARACRDAGHEVRVAAPESFAGAVTSAGFDHEPVGDVDPAALGAVFGRTPHLRRSEANTLVLQQVFGRLDRDAALPAMRSVLDRWRPHAVLREPAELASYVACEERGIPHVQTNIGISGMDDRLLPLLEVTLTEIGCSASALRAAPRWTVVPPSFDEDAELVTGPVTRFRDPDAGSEAQQALPEWWPDSDLPLVYVSFGSIAAGMGLFPSFYARVVDLLGDVPARVLLTLGEAGDASLLGNVPPNVHVERWWPQRDVLSEASVVVGHGGFGTTQGALVAGVPQVVVPLFSFDQFLNADRVASAGVGVALVDDDAAGRLAGDTVPHGPDAAGGLAEAVHRVLGDARITSNAARVAAEVDGLPDATECVALLDDL